MTTNHRFYLNEDNRIIDKLNPANNEKAEWHEQLGYPKNEESFRVLLLWRRLGELVHDLIINTNPLKKLHNGKKYQSVNEEAGSIWTAFVPNNHSLTPAYARRRAVGPAQVWRRSEAQEKRLAGCHVTVAVRGRR